MTKVIATTLIDGKPVKTEHEIESNDSGFTVIVHQQGIKVDVPEFVEVNPQNTINCIATISQPAWEWISGGQLFRHLWQEAFDPDDRTDPPQTVEVLKMMDYGFQHVAGMIILGCEACMAGKSVFYRNPETYLHPKTERYIAGMLQKMLSILGRSGTITKVAEGKEQDSQNVEAVSQNKVGQEKDDTLLWLQKLHAHYGPGKAIANLNNNLVTVEQMIEEVKNDTKIGEWMVSLFLELRGG